MNIARGIVTEAYDQLIMEGYLEGIHGSGTYVRKELVWNSFKATPTIGLPQNKSDSQTEKTDAAPVSFIPGMPDMNLFPRRKWLSCYHEALEYADRKDLEYAPASGRWDLRNAICNHLGETKGINAVPEQIVITSGSSQAFSLLTQVIKTPKVVMEDPQAEFVYRIFRESAASLTLIPVDEQGIIDRKIPDNRQDLIYVTPSHQFPLGGTLSADRRIALLKKAQQTGAYIIEDDYDSEFRYLGKPVPPLQVMAPERIVFVGTFSKIVSPALRIGFMVLPGSLITAVKELKSRWDFRNEGLQQKAMAIFIMKGHLSRHIARAHKYYQQKSKYLKDSVTARLSSQWKISGDTTGMHLVLNKMNKDGGPEDVSAIVYALKKKGFLLNKGSAYCRTENKSHNNALLISFSKPSAEDLDKLISALAEYGKES